MPHDYDDHDEAGFGLRETIDEASGVDASGGYSIPATPFVIAPYRSLAVFVKPAGGGSFSVTVTWDMDGEAGGATAEETKVSTLAQGETLVFRNQGVQVVDVTINASASTSYAVMPSDVDPLASAADDANQWPTWYECVNLAHLPDLSGAIAPAVQYWINSGWKSVLDATFHRGFYFDSGNVAGKEIVFVLRLGGQGSIWNVQPVVAIGPAEGRLEISWAQTAYGEDAPGAGDPNDFNVTYDQNFLPHPADFGAGVVTYYHCSPYFWDLNAVALSKINASPGTLSQMRVMGDPGDVLSADGVATFGRNYVARDMNGGPGIWYLKLKNVAGTSGQSRVRISSLLVARQTGFDYSTV